MQIQAWLTLPSNRQLINKRAMMIAENNVEYDPAYSDRLLVDSVANNASAQTSPQTIESAVAPLARYHLAHQHYYPLDSESSHDMVSADTRRVNIEYQHPSLAVEAAVAIVINGIHYAVLMASPHQLEYLAVGFLFSEGLIQHSYELLDWDVIPLDDITNYQQLFHDPSTQSLIDDNSPDKNIESSALAQDLTQLQDYDIYLVNLTISQRCHQRIQAQRRQLAGRTGCGMCGITGLTQALPDLSAYHRHDIQQVDTSRPSLDYLLNIRQQVDVMQHTHQLTGAVHAAATLHKQQLYLFEDVGRHNALDKLIGWQLRHNIKISCVVMTSRLSIELVQKSIRGRIPWLIGMSAPTSTAVRVAERYNLGLAGFLRDDRVTYYTGH